MISLLTLQRIGHYLAAVLLTFGSLGAQAPQPTPIMQLPPAAASPTPIPYVASRPADTPVANLSTGNLRLSDIATYAQTQLVQPLRGIPLTRLNEAPSGELIRAARFIAARMQADRELQTSGSAELRQQATTEFEQRAIQELASGLYREKVLDKVTTPSQQAVQEYYTNHLPEFIEPAYFKMRHLILYTYQPYVVKAGDTLESIAQAVNGDSAVADQIRADIEQRPLRREPAKEFKPLVEGEQLLVPMNAASAEKVRLRLESLVRQVGQSGVKFEDIATTHSDAETKGQIIGPLPSGSRPLVPELMKYGFETPLEQISPPFRTKHGWNVIQVTERQTTRTPSVDEVTTRIQQTLRNTEQEKLKNDLLTTLIDQPGITIHGEVFDRVTRNETVSTDTVVYTAGEREVRWRDLERSWLTTTQPTTPEARREALKSLQPVVLANLMHYMDRTLGEATTEERSRRDALRTMVRGTTYLNYLLQLVLEAEVTDQEVREYYEQQQDMFALPARVKFNTMAMHSNATTSTTELAPAEVTRLSGELERYLGRVKTAEDFERIAQQLNSEVEASGRLVPQAPDWMALNGLNEAIRTQLEQLKPGEWSKPFVADGLVISVMLKEKAEAEARPFEEVRDRIRAMLTQQQNFEELMRNVEERMLNNIRFEPVLQP